MPSQSISEGESTPDHLIRTESPDLKRVVELREIETWDCKEGSKKVKNTSSMRGTMLSQYC